MLLFLHRFLDAPAGSRRQAALHALGLDRLAGQRTGGRVAGSQAVSGLPDSAGAAGDQVVAADLAHPVPQPRRRHRRLRRHGNHAAGSVWRADHAAGGSAEPRKLDQHAGGGLVVGVRHRDHGRLRRLLSGHYPGAHRCGAADGVRSRSVRQLRGLHRFAVRRRPQRGRQPRPAGRPRNPAATTGTGGMPD